MRWLMCLTLQLGEIYTCTAREHKKTLLSSSNTNKKSAWFTNHSKTFRHLASSLSLSLSLSALNLRGLLPVSRLLPPTHLGCGSLGAYKVLVKTRNVDDVTLLEVLCAILIQICIVASLGNQEVCSVHHHHIIYVICQYCTEWSIMNQKSNRWKKLKGGPAKFSEVSRAVASRLRRWQVMTGLQDEMEWSHIRVSRVNNKVVGQVHLQDTPEQNRVPVTPSDRQARESNPACVYSL